MKCRHCNTELETIFCDLQTCPPSNAMVKFEELNEPEKYLPLKVFVCSNCWLVQTDEIKKADQLFNDEYTYFSSFSSSWLEHSKKYVDYVIDRFGFNENSKVIEIASNDGYLLQYFKEKNIPVLGVEPTSNTAKAAIDKGIETITEFFGSDLAKDKLQNKADLILGNNVLAHLPDINDFVKGVKIALKLKGVSTFEFPHLCKLIELNQFDTIYHEHFSYLSLNVVKTIFEFNDLEIFDVQQLPTHGGSLRIFAKHKEDFSKKIEKNVFNMLEFEESIGVNTLNYYKNFQSKVDDIRSSFLSFLIKAKSENKKVVGYGAAAKGNTLLNYCGIKASDFIDYVVDASPFKQGKYLPGSRIPVFQPDKIKETLPDYIIVFPWNLKSEITSQLSFIREFGGKFVINIPELKIF
jgi:hypothetical protein